MTARSHAFAQARAPDGRVLTSDVGDSRTGPPVDEVDLLEPVPAPGAWTASTAATPCWSVDGLDGRHTLLVRSDGAIWVSEHGTGRILALHPGAG